ncbi:winged helix-turn-helix domain-containing protein [Nocardiopsis sp. N85]|uniref:winged helix-turn-helix domain-containing protein n=1 Tax=Nocardiopsis sp. N85 TaxID=3029400 RepID=UPI00237FAD72|nr:winged helix-turn-helix domain-containing protein [Nocardiopsis sp. N85]MDE3722893.1 winged helix-turn-helix domain-containing protein [Nocardiopsis sp. N85]
MELPLSSPRTPAEYEKRRLFAAELFDQGELSQAAIARLLGVSRQAFHKWHTTWKSEGPAALTAHPRGAEPFLNGAQERALAALLDSAPTKHGWPDQSWTLERINHLIRERFHVAYADPSRVWRLLKRMGFSHQAPAMRAAEGDEEEVDRWRTQVWPWTKGGR